MNTLRMQLQRRELDNAIEADIRRQLEGGSRKTAFGHYFEIVNGVMMPPVPNMLPDEGIHSMLDIWLGATSKIAAWYVALYGTAIDPAANWTAANFTATAGEITSQTEGYSGGNRATYTPSAASSRKIDNLTSEAAFAIVATTTINVNGAALLSAQARGATTGKLASASRYPTTRVLANGDAYEVGYRVTITS